jgi:hypothetical protein
VIIIAKAVVSYEVKEIGALHHKGKVIVQIGHLVPIKVECQHRRPATAR